MFSHQKAPGLNFAANIWAEDINGTLPSSWKPTVLLWVSSRWCSLAHRCWVCESKKKKKQKVLSCEHIKNSLHDEDVSCVHDHQDQTLPPGERKRPHDNQVRSTQQKCGFVANQNNFWITRDYLILFICWIGNLPNYLLIIDELQH